MLKVGSSQPQPQEPMPVPPMDNQQAPVDGQVLPTENPADMNPGQSEEPNPFQADFDAGVDADEKTDPKNFIRQLTGKLSQSLVSYDNEQPKVDVELKKYVANMILKQCMKGLPSDVVDEIIEKAKTDNETDQKEQPSDEDDMNAVQDNQSTEMPTESLSRSQRMREVKNAYQDIVKGSTEKADQLDGLKVKNNNYTNKPFSAPNFK